MPLSLKYGIDYLSTSTSAYIAGGCFLAYGIRKNYSFALGLSQWVLFSECDENIR